MHIVASTKRFINNNFHALTHKNYRYFWLGQCVSLIGTWTQNIGQSWLVLSITDSAFLLGLVGTLQFLPVTFFSLFAGVITDKFPKKKILIFTQTISMLLAFILSGLVFTHTVKYEYILVLALCLGFCNTLDMPTRQAFNMEIVGKEDLMNAIALNSATFNLARIIGPAIGAMLMGYLGAGWCFLLNGFSFMAVIYGLVHIEAVAYVRMKSSQEGILREIVNGLRYIKKNPVLLETLILVSIMGIFVFNYSVLIPVFTKNILHMDAKTYGILLSALGAGSLIGAVLVSLKSKGGPNRILMIGSSIAIGIMLIVTGMSNLYYFTALSLAITGIFNMFFSTTANSTLQLNSKDEYRGRVMSVYSLVFAGFTPIGSLFSGFVAEKYGARVCFILSGIFTIVLILLLMTWVKLRKKDTNTGK
ncbi:MFS transporter [Clostridium sp. FP2]|uniref:MFS transporter n=1 Tax=Clostridium TaxID=1485 RepID=UPI0013E983CA|nr:MULTISPECIES: MFS transporter [Clostridium]MBW9158930.1 MFS transporter [Clostridium tagluense]MBZ9624870.1 MFS transporter [Clostridium sp. FP2]WLC64687.1 MFS transporter [Clostridium tagluense]